MHLFIDESGSFVIAPHKNSWCCVGCYVIPEGDYFRAKAALQRLKVQSGFKKSEEVKLGSIPESVLVDFLKELNDISGTYHAVAIDMGEQKMELVKQHQMKQSELIGNNIDKMKYDEGKRAVAVIRDRIISLSPQLYIQLQCQFKMMIKVIKTIVSYYAQRNPACLGRFQWRVDQKNMTKTDFENSFEILSPAILQTDSMSEPIVMCVDWDYSYMKRFEYPPGEEPKYLSDLYGEMPPDIKGHNIGKIIREDIEFIDSNNSAGVQIADILTSSLRRCLRGEFRDNENIAELLGGLMVQQANNTLPVELIAIGTDGFVSEKVGMQIKLMQLNCRPFIYKNI